MPGDVVHIAIGSNEGDRLLYLRAALDELAATPGISLDPDRDVASLYESRPVGGPLGQGSYLNTCVRIRTELAPRSLLERTKAIESSLGRVRGERWGARTIDLDILFYGDVILDADGLTLPHPRLSERRFVLDPLEELAGEFIHPVLGEPIASIAARVRRVQPLESARIVGPRDWHTTMPSGVA